MMMMMMMMRGWKKVHQKNVKIITFLSETLPRKNKRIIGDMKGVFIKWCLNHLIH